MSSFLIALSVALQTTAASPPMAPIAAVTPLRSLKDVPNVTIAYYDVTGKDMKSINKSIEKQRPKDPVTGQVNTGGTSWNVSPTFRRRTVNGVCTITEVTTAFTGRAELPRLANEAKVKPEVLQSWRSFSAGMEQDAAARLWFVHDRLGGLKQLMLGKDCDQAVKEGGAFLDKLKADSAAFQPPQPAPAAPAPAQ
jgi:predicted secreted Zn-dependent protease